MAPPGRFGASTVPGQGEARQGQTRETDEKKPGRLTATGLLDAWASACVVYSARAPKTGPPAGRGAPSPVRISSAIRLKSLAIRRSPSPSARIAVRNRNRILSSTFIIVVVHLPPSGRHPTTTPPTYLPTATRRTLFHHSPNQMSQTGVPLHATGGHRRHPVQPGPRTGRPGIAPVCTPSVTTATPFTKTSSIPVEGWCGSSYVAWSPTVVGSKTTMSA